MQMIKDMEESVLRLGNAGKFLNIINNQYINCLVEVYKVVCSIVSHRISVLHLKQMSRHIQHTLFRIQFFNLCSNSIGQMGFSHS